MKYRQWGEGLEHEAVMQMEKACLLPVSVAGALMPDAHVGYGLPIGGVLATENAVIPYAVGVDIACRMKMTVLDIPVRDLEQKQDRLTRAIEAETRFGVGANFKHRRAHDVLDADWSVSPITKQNKDTRVVATRHERQRKSFRGVRPVHGATDRIQWDLEAGELTWRCCRTAAVAARARRCAITTARSRSASFRICQAN